MFDKWYSMQAEDIKHRVLDWAKRNDLTPRDAWFRHPQMTNSPHRTLALLAPYLTPDEIRELRIPFRAIEALFSELYDK